MKYTIATNSESEMKRFMVSYNCVAAISEYLNELRNIADYSENEIDVQYATEWRAKLRIILDEYGVNLDKLM